MKRNVFVLLITSFFFLTVVPKLWADSASTAKKIPFDEVRIIIELNSTDEDVGIQVFLDADGWEKVNIVTPGGNTVFEVQNSGKFKKQGLTELFFESEEPSLDEVPLSEFLARFPEGEYKFFGKTIEGDRLVGSAILTHNIPDGPSIVSPEEGDVLDPKKVVIRWDAVTTPPGIVIAGYQVIVETEDPVLRVFSVDLPPEARSVRVPSQFFALGKDYKVEVLAREIGGNQTISETPFEIK